MNSNGNSIFFNKKIVSIGFDSLINQLTNILFDKYGTVSRQTEVNKLSLNNILTNLIISYLSNRNLIVSRRSNNYSGFKWYGFNHFTYKLIIKWIELLIREGYISQIEGFYDIETNSGQRSKLFLTDKLIFALSNLNNSNSEIDTLNYSRNIVLKDKYKNIIMYSPSERTRKMTSFMNRYNELIKGSKVILPVDSEMLKEISFQSSFFDKFINLYHVILTQILLRSSSNLYSRIPYMITLATNYISNKGLQAQLHRVFNNGKFTEGGRFYGGNYQQLSKKDRAKILINNSPIVEIDFSALHLNMLYNKTGKYFDKDPYTSVNNNPEVRPILKLVSLIAINSENKEQALRAIRSEINRDINLIRLKENYHLDEKDLLGKFESTHFQISNYFYSGIGTKLQNFDSQLAETILKHFTNREIPCLCVHDSFIVPKDYQDELNEVMLNNYKQQFGFPCKVKIEGN